MVHARLLVWAGLGLCLAGGRGMFAQPVVQEQTVPQLPPPINKSDDPLLERFVWRSIGPAVMGGRLDDIAVHDSNASTIYVGFATGGVWKTENNGTTWAPIFDRYPVSSIGDIEIAPSNPKIVYVGTGEPNNRQSSSFGAGVYKSTDGGKNFEYVGLKETQSIGRMVIHPKDPNIVYVAAVGHLFGPNPERGLYKTTDGGKTWTNTKFIDNDTGFIDVVMHPTDPNTLIAASYQRRRQPWGFNGGGPDSGIWKTTDGGKTWSRLLGSGLPTNPIIGRIGLNYSRSNPNIVYAQIEVGASGGTGAGVNDGRQPGSCRRSRWRWRWWRWRRWTRRQRNGLRIRTERVSGGRTTAASRGSSAATTTTARCTTARSASIRATRRSCTRPARTPTSRPMAERSSTTWAGRATAITISCGSTRATAII